MVSTVYTAKNVIIKRRTSLYLAKRAFKKGRC
jgi:hypothetical protein